VKAIAAVMFIVILVGAVVIYDQAKWIDRLEKRLETRADDKGQE
jgi:hypothetical protein